MTTFQKLIILLILLFVSHTVLAKIILSAPPRETLKEGEQYYGSIAKELTKVLGETVVYEQPKNWTYYAVDMRAGKYDLVFDGPHFADWRMKHIGHEPLARLSGNLQFYILAKKDDKKLATMQDLLGKSFCGLASPNLGTMAAFALYNNPIVQPNIQIVKGGMKNVMDKFLSGECRAAVVRNKVYDKLPAEQKAKINIIAKSRAMPNQTITASTKISAEKRQKILRFLTSDYGSKSADSLLNIYSKKNKFFIPATTSEFEGLSELLEGVVFGW